MNTWTWWRAALIRSLKTFCQSAIALIPTSGLLLHEIPWLTVASASAVAAILSLLTSIATGLPENDLALELKSKNKIIETQSALLRSMINSDEDGGVKNDGK